MGWSIGYDSHWQRDIGYGVPAYCDHPDCDEKIDRGLSYVCGGEPYGGEEGCGLYFCPKHQYVDHQHCERCKNGETPFDPSPDHPEWIAHKMIHPSWQEWRDDNPTKVYEMEDVMDRIWSSIPKNQINAETA